MKNKVIVGSAVFVIAFFSVLLFSSKEDQKFEQTLVNTMSLPVVESKEEVTLGKKTITHLKLNLSRTLFLNSEVSAQSVDVIIESLKKLNTGDQPIYLLIDSPGGSVVDGASLISQMEAMRVPINTVCLKLCASMAALIHQYGTNRYALDRAVLMFHPASGGAEGQLPNMLALLNMLDRYTGRMNEYIINRSGMNRDKYHKYVAYGLWIDTEDALANGLVDGIVSIDTVFSQPAQGFGSERSDDLIKSLRNFVN